MNKRYQVYLDPNSVAIIDDYAEIVSLDRSQLIREAVDRLSYNLSILLKNKGEKKVKSNSLLALNGLISSNTQNSKVTNYATEDDSKYLKD